MKNDSILNIHGLSSTYTSRPWGIFGKREVNPVLDKIDLTIERGEIFGRAAINAFQIKQTT